jgi:hypothetical protein
MIYNYIQRNPRLDALYDITETCNYVIRYSKLCFRIGLDRTLLFSASTLFLTDLPLFLADVPLILAYTPQYTILQHNNYYNSSYFSTSDLKYITQINRLSKDNRSSIVTNY